jgi:hypothetical protein
LFIDVEGYEVEALRGAVKTLATGPDCFVEVHVGAGLERFGGSVADLLRFFPKEQFTLHVHSESHRQPVLLASAPVELLKTRFFLTAVSHVNGPERAVDDGQASRTI